MTRLADIDRMLRSGRRAEAVRRLRALDAQRATVAELARLWRRAGHAEKALRLLARLDDPTDLEKAEHGAALINLGAEAAGLRLLAQVDGRVSPRVLLLQSFPHIRRWDWAASLPFLEQYSVHPALSPARRAAGRMYLATSLMHGPAALDRSRALLEAIRDTDGSFTWGTARLLLAQNHVLAGDVRRALRVLDDWRARTRGRRPPLLALMGEQWRCLIELRSGNPAQAAWAREALATRVRPGFEAIGAWEWARGCDVFAAECLRDPDWLARLHFGSPHPRLKERLAAAAGPLPETLDWPGPRPGPLLDLAEGAVGRHRLKPGQLPHRLLSVLASDLHRPFTIAELHEGLFPGEAYVPVTSPDRAHKILSRLREWLERAGAPVRVAESRARYRLAFTGRGAIRLRRERETPATVDALRARFAGRSFTAREAAAAWRCAERSAQRRLLESVRRAELAREGRARETHYFFAPTQPLITT
jgi:hypothetical protein